MSELLAGRARRVALLVDVDNLTPSLADPIFRAAGRLGHVDVRRVYAAEAGFRAWQDAAGYRAIQVGGAKNGTDLLLCIEAVELACRGEFSSFALASDDRDFSHLAHWLRERGLHVLGLGTSKASPGWRAACSEFEVMGLGAASTQNPKPIGPLTDANALSKTNSLVRDLIRAEGADGAIEIGHLGVRMCAIHNITLARLGVPSWRAYLESVPNLVQLDPKGPKARVRWVGT